MNKVFTVSSIITALSLTTVTMATAKPVLEASPSVNQTLTSEFLIASPFQTDLSPAHQRRHRLMEMLVLQMEMNELAVEAQKSEDPDVRALASEMMKSSDAMSNKLLELIQSSPRSGQFSR